MMEHTKWKPLDLKRLDFLLFLGIGILFLLRIALLFTEVREENVLNAYLSPVIVAMIVYVLMRLGLPRTPAVALPPVFALWYLVTRILNGDWYLHASHAYVYYVLLSCCVLFIAPFLAGRELREKYLTGVALTYSVVFGVIAWVAVIAALSGHPWQNPLDGAPIIGINETYANPYRLNILDIHPNISAILLYSAFALLFFLFFRTRRLWVRIGYGVLGLGLYLAICLTGSISSIGVTGTMIGLVVFALIFHAKKAGKLRGLIAAVSMVAVIAAVVLTYPLVIRWTATLYETVQQTGSVGELLIPSASAQEAAPPADTGEPTQSPAFVDERLEVETMTATMRGRFEMYYSALLSIKDRPITLLTGELLDAAMARSARLINYSYQNHLHNSYLQTLVVGGGISVLMALLFTVLLAIHGLRLFFRKGIPMQLRVLVLAPVGMVIHSMTEAFLFIDTRIPNMLFFFLSGMILAFSMELCPKPYKPKRES